LSEMSETQEHTKAKTYYVYGSGLIPVPDERVNDVSQLKSEFHASEAKRAMLYALAIRTA